MPVRRLVAAVAVVVVALTYSGPVSADTASELKAARKRLGQLEKETAAARAELADLQARADALQVQVEAAQTALEITGHNIVLTQGAITRAEDRIAALQGRLDDRARSAYIQGPGTVFDIFFGASSFADLQERLALYDRVQQQDSDLANRVRDRRETLDRKKGDLRALQAQQERQKAELEEKQAEQQKQLDAQGKVVAAIEEKAAEAQTLVKTLEKQKAREDAARARALAAGGGAIAGEGIFQFCPVDAPNAFGDDFGAPRYAGGYHPHAGNDIVASLGTPIRAPFDGYASDASNGLGGMSVHVDGALGYTYNAHLSRFGTLGNVSAGTIVGYVGNSGDAMGGPYHDHFEWHPDTIPPNLHTSPYGYSVIGSAIDPYPYLVAACR
ncbi:MAG TPA: peptidoglycan DD-metalloendopeptidase family protein [Actinomycetota bacterium]|nr:peptidoglycan DD-metalloendopeptidase family protein [Actinomycetota bacterium]